MLYYYAGMLPEPTTLIPLQTEEDAVLPEGFWRELFLLNPDKKRLLQILEPLTADDLLQLHVCVA
jgi:hypothetical protein